MKNVARSLGAALFTLAAMSAVAATQDGDIDETSSTGTVDITLNITSAIVVANLDSIPMTADGTTPANTALEGRDTFCVGGFGFANGAYAIEFESATAVANSASGFQLDGSSHDLTYNVAFTSDVAPTASGAAVDNSTGQMAGTFALNEGVDCPTADNNAQVIVSVPATEWESALDSSYTDVLTITVTGQ